MAKQKNQLKDQNIRKIKASENVIWGIHPITELLENDPKSITEIFIDKAKSSGKIQAIIDLAREKRVRVRFEASLDINTLDNTENTEPIRHQGVVAKTIPIGPLSEDDFLTNLANIKEPFLLALDSIQDPHNLGAILRSAAASGVNGVILPKDRSAPLGGTAAKVSAGALPHLKICLVTNLAEFLKKLKQESVWIYGTVKDSGQIIHQTNLTGSVCLVIGNEEKGIRPLVAKQCDQLITIPMPGKLDSLNASVAAGITMFEVVRQRSNSFLIKNSQ